MAKPKPFLFDYSFDDGADEARQAEQDARLQAEYEAEASRPQTFTLKEFEAAKAEAHARGRQEGISDATAGLEQQVARTLDTVFAQLPKVFEQHDSWAREIEADAVRLAVTVMRKLAPEMTRDREQPEVEHIIREAFGFLTQQPKVMIRVARQLDEPLKEKVDLMASRVGYEGQVVLVADPDLPLDDCRISWQAGAVERSLADIWSQIDEIIARGLAGQPTHDRENPQADPPEDRMSEAESAAETPDDEMPGVEPADLETPDIEAADDKTADIETADIETPADERLVTETLADEAEAAPDPQQTPA